MSAPITVLAATNVRSEAAIVLASLPLSYAPGDSAEGGVVVVGGTADWPKTAAGALDHGSVAVIVVHPEPAEVHALWSRNALVALDTRWASNPVIESAAKAFADALPRGTRLEVQVRQPVGSPLETALLDQLILVRALVGPLGELRILSRSSHGYAAVGLVAEHPVDLSLVCTDAVPESASVRLLTDDGSVELTIPSSVNAQPAQLTVTGPDGARVSPTLYESGHRATWRRVRTLLTTSSTAADLDDFTSDGETARTAFQLAEG